MLREMISGTNAIWKGAKRAANSVGTLVQNIAKTVSKYNKENFVSAYRQSAKHTMPAEYLPKTENTAPKSIIRRFADIVLLPIFSSLPGWISGFFLAPFVYYTYKNTLSFFQLPIDLVYYDIKKKIKLDWQGGLYGLLGAAAGFLFGSIAGSMFFVWRVLEQTWHTTASFMTRLINWSVSDLKESHVILSPKIQVTEYRHEGRTAFEKNVGLFFGSIVYIPVGVITLGTIGMGRFVVNTAVSVGRGIALGANTAVSDMAWFSPATNDPNDPSLDAHTYELIPRVKEYRNDYQRYFFGGSGTLLIGPALTIVSFATVLTARVIGNSIYSFIRVTAKTAHIFLKNTYADKAFDVGDDPRDKAIAYDHSKRLGYPGQYILGIPAILLGASIGFISRLSIETGISFINTARITFNLALQNTPSYQPLKPLKAQRNHYERAIGFVGYFLGVVIPLPVTLSIALGRTLFTNLITTKHFTRFFLQERSTLHGALEVEPINHDDETTSFYDSNDDETENTAFIIALNVESRKPILARFFSWLRKVNSSSGADNRPLWLQIFSFPGIVIGSVLGGGLRAIVETTLTSIDTVIASLNLALYRSRFANQFKPMKPNRNTLEKVLGSFGYILGGILGITPFLAIGAARWVITNGDSTKRAFIATVNALLATDDPLRLKEPIADTRPNVVKASSFLGYTLGGVLGLSREFGLNTIRSFGRQIRYYGKSALLESGLDSKITDLSQDTRTRSQKRLGYFGALSGTGFGWIAYGSITFARIVGNSVISAYHTVRDMIEMAFLDDYPTADTFTETRRLKAFREGSPVALQSDDLTYAPYEAIFLESEEDSDDELAAPHHPLAEPPDLNLVQRREDLRKNRPFIFGTPGLIIGGIIGLGAFSIAGFGRIMLNSAITTWNTTLDFTDTILPEGVSTAKTRVSQNKPIPRLMGYPIGKLLGTLITGPLAWLAVLLYRFTTNTVMTSFLTAEIITTLPPIRNNIRAYRDSRKQVDKNFGWAGFVLGGFALSIVFGSVGYVANVLWHIAYHSAITAERAFIYSIFWVMGSRLHKLLVGVKQSQFSAYLLEGFYPQKKQTTFERYGFGLLGYLVGFALSAPFSSMIALGRFALLNGKLFAIGFMQAANLTLEKPFSTEQMALLDALVNHIPFGKKSIALSPENLSRLKYSFGAVGFSLGSIVGTLFMALPVGAYRLTKESGRSYYHLSQSLLNVGLEEPYFKNGIATDKRAVKMKLIGGLGYLAACVTTGLVPVANVLTKSVAVLIAILFSGFVAVYKAIQVAYYPRFKPIASGETAHVEKDRKLRLLVSTLSYGELPSNTTLEEKFTAQLGATTIVDEQPTGRKGAYDFIVKSLCFNEERLCESILYAKVKKNQEGKSTHLSAEELKAIKDKHHGSFFFNNEMRQKHNDVIDTRCDDIDRFIDGYLAGTRQRTPEKKDPQFSAQELFNYRP